MPLIGGVHSSPKCPMMTTRAAPREMRAMSNLLSVRLGTAVAARRVVPRRHKAERVKSPGEAYCASPPLSQMSLASVRYSWDPDKGRTPSNLRQRSVRLDNPGGVAWPENPPQQPALRKGESRQAGREPPHT